MNKTSKGSFGMILLSALLLGMILLTLSTMSLRLAYHAGVRAKSIRQIVNPG